MYGRGSSCLEREKNRRAPKKLGDGETAERLFRGPIGIPCSATNTFRELRAVPSLIGVVVRRCYTARPFLLRPPPPPPKQARYLRTLFDQPPNRRR